MPTQLSPGKEPGQRLPPPLPPPQVCTALPREDSDAEEDWLTLRAMSESLSSWEPLRDPDGDGITGLDCRVPKTKETPSEGRALLCSSLALRGLHLSLPVCLTGEHELPHRVLMEPCMGGWWTAVMCLPGHRSCVFLGNSAGVLFHTVQASENFYLLVSVAV